jgi:hypothetical protein
MFAIPKCVLIASLVGATPPPKRARLPDGIVHVSQGLGVSGLSPLSQRVVEVYNFTEIVKVYGSEFGDDLWDVVNQDQSDDEFTPAANSNRSETTPFGRLELGPTVASSEQSVIYEIVGYPDLLIKYQANCIELHPHHRVSETSYVHPLVVDYLYGRKAARARVGPRMFYLSPPSQVCLYQQGKCGFRMRSKDFNHCVNQDGASLRYMIIERVQGISLHSFKKRFKNGIVPFHTSLLIGYGMIDYLERLHNVAKTIHGDVHAGNILLDHISDRNGTVSLKIIDYGRSFSNMERVNETVRDIGWATDPVFSSWELEGYEPAARDDIERAVRVVAGLMMPWSFAEAEKKLSDLGPSAILEWKRTGYWFFEPRPFDDIRPRYDPVRALRIADEHKANIRYNLQLILKRVRSMRNVNSIPPYADFLKGFRLTRNIVLGARVEFMQS